ncbi:hypothetical protein ES703_105244 [subsurface metagenome]
MVALPLLADKPAAVIIGDVEEGSITGFTLSAGLTGQLPHRPLKVSLLPGFFKHGLHLVSLVLQLLFVGGTQQSRWYFNLRQFSIIVLG